MGNLIKKDKQKPYTHAEASTSTIEYTAKGNKRYRLTPISKEDRERLRVNVYSYLL